MTIQKDDPRLTQYLHDEMTDAEKEAFEAELAESPEAREELEGLTQVSAQLEESFKDVPEESLTDDRRDRVMDEAKENDAPKRPSELRVIKTVLAAAAAMAIAVWAVQTFGPKGEPKTEPVVVADSGADTAQDTGKPTTDPHRQAQARGREELLKELSRSTAVREEAKSFSLQMARPRTMKKKDFSANGMRVAESYSSSVTAKGYVGGPPPVRGGPVDGEMIQGHNTESYDPISENGFRTVKAHPLSTFSIDVDTASYANMRRFLNRRQLPPADAVRIEELINYFDYAYPTPTNEHPFSVNMEMAECPWNDAHRLVRIGLKGKEIFAEERANSNLVFLLDVSGSMRSQSKLPLLKKAMKLLVNELSSKDRVAIAVYAGAAGLVLPSTPADQKETILAALDKLQSGGSTNGGAGIKLAYKTAIENFIEGGINRVILATDGDFNVGVSNNGDLTRLIEKSAKSGVFLSILGFGTGNYKDARMEQLSNKGNGNYAYIDTINEAEKVLVKEMGGTLITIAKDVKIQIEFNPAHVAGYRLIGYENRMLKKEDFNDDKKDAGEIGAGHTVTAIYELVPAGVKVPAGTVDALKYQTPSDTTSDFEGEAMTVKLRYKKPDGDTSTLLTVPLADTTKAIDAASADFKFAVAVAQFGMLLRDSKHKGSASFASVKQLAEAGLSADKFGYRKEFLGLVDAAKRLKSTK